MNIIGQLLCSFDLGSIKLASILVHGELSRAQRTLKDSEYRLVYNREWFSGSWKSDTKTWVLVDKANFIRAYMYVRKGHIYRISIPKSK